MYLSPLGKEMSERVNPKQVLIDIDLLLQVREIVMEKGPRMNEADEASLEKIAAMFGPIDDWINNVVNVILPLNEFRFSVIDEHVWLYDPASKKGIDLSTSVTVSIGGRIVFFDTPKKYVDPSQYRASARPRSTQRRTWPDLKNSVGETLKKKKY